MIRKRRNRSCLNHRRTEIINGADDPAPFFSDFDVVSWELSRGKMLLKQNCLEAANVQQSRDLRS